MIKGAWKVEDGVPSGIDVAKLRHEHGEAAKAFLEKL
jgi:8-oxoguanine deaminase